MKPEWRLCPGLRLANMAKATFVYRLQTRWPTLKPRWKGFGILYKVLLLDGIAPAGVEIIQRSKSIEPIVHDKISREQLLKIVPDADGIVVRSGTMIDRELMQQARRLKVVGRAGVGVDNVD